MVVVPTREMSGKSETLAETPPSAVMEIGVGNANSVKLAEEKMMICSSNCEDNTFDDAPAVPEEKQIITCTNNSEDNTFHMEVSPSAHDQKMPIEDSNEDVKADLDVVEDVKIEEERVADHTMPSKASVEDVQVDILGDVEADEERVANGESRDVTESSTSFGSTDSETGIAAVSSDVEVESQAQDGSASLLKFDAFSNLFGIRKKKVTNHWRKFVRPVMWRCKWVELQLRELHSQVSKYDRELAESDRKKQFKLDRGPTEDLGIKSTPFINQNRPVKLMKRKKRKRVEEIVDIASHTSTHSLLSYYTRKRPFASSACMDDDHSNSEVNPAKKIPFGSDEFGITGGWTPFEFKDRDAFESVLRKIDEAQLQIRQLKAQMDKLVTQHAGKFTSDGSSLAPEDPLGNCGPSSALPEMNIEKTPFASVCTTSQQCQVTPLPDMFESTDKPQTEGKCDTTGNDLTYDQPVKEELNDGEEVVIQPAESSLAAKGKAVDVQNITNPNSASKVPVAREQSAVKTRSISKLVTPKNKRKRGRRKARSGRWTRKSSG